MMLRIMGDNFPKLEDGEEVAVPTLSLSQYKAKIACMLCSAMLCLAMPCHMLLPPILRPFAAALAGYQTATQSPSLVWV